MAVLTTHLHLLAMSVAVVFGFKKNPDLCTSPATDPYLDPEMVLGKPWVAYHTWNMNLNLQNKCNLYVVFNYATPSIVQRIRKKAYEFMETQPAWETAILHGLYARVGSVRRDILLFPHTKTTEEGYFSNFLALIVSSDNNTPKEIKSLLNVQMKLIFQDRFLLVTICEKGVTFILARLEDPPPRTEILRISAHLGLGQDYPTCVTVRKKDERFLVK